jgi:hypothetical protein
MNLIKYKPLLFLTALAGMAYLVHTLLFHFLKIQENLFHYSLETLYLIFFGLSTLVFLVLLKVKEKSFDNIGMSFLLGTSVKMIFCYLILKPILETDSYDNTIEKINFFGMFILFLTIETVLTIRILNKK